MKLNFFKKIWGRKEEKEETKKEEPSQKDIKIKEVFESFKIFPLSTEKSNLLSREGKYVFLVDPKLNKNQIKSAIQKMFNVNVLQVRTMNYKERIRGLTKIKSRRKRFKKAIVQLKEGEKITLSE